MNAVKIVCDQCGAKHQIGADKLQEIQKKETFKIRCKSCSKAITVYTKNLFAEQQPAPEPVQAEPSVDIETLQWFAMI